MMDLCWRSQQWRGRLRVHASAADSLGHHESNSRLYTRHGYKDGIKIDILKTVIKV